MGAILGFAYFNSIIGRLLKMIEEASEVYDQEKKEEHVSESHPKKGSSKQVPFNKATSISFMKMGQCHMCKLKGKIVYQCFRNYQATSCEKKFCFDCLTLIYKDNILETLQKTDSWRCPYIRKVCRCKNCCITRKEQASTL